MKDKIVYKVVEAKSALLSRAYFWKKISSGLKKSNRKYCSCIVFDMDCAVSYEIGRTTKPKIGKLFAFNSFTHAKSFKNPTQVILECKAKNVVFEDRIALNISDSSVKKFWKLGRSWILTGRAPNGTVVCDSITPIKIIK